MIWSARSNNMRGVTLLEMIIALAIVALVAVLAAGVFSSFRTNNVLTTADSIVIGLLRDAHGRTMASQSNSNYGVHFESTQAVLFKGDVYNAADPLNEAYLLPSDIEISSISLTGGGNEVVFTRLYGKTASPGTVTLRSKSDNSKTRVITVLSTGGIQ